jgi:hypothetical protein
MLDFYNSQDEQTTLNQSLQGIQQHYPVEPADLPDFSHFKFELLKHYTNFLNRQTIRISNTNTYVSFVEVEYRVPKTKYGSGLAKDFQFYVFCFLNERYGHTLIKRETVSDKLNELFVPVEIDFEDDPTFSKKFYVLTKEKDKAIKIINSQFRLEVCKLTQDEILIEILDNTIVITNKKTVNADDVLELVGLGRNLEKARY